MTALSAGGLGWRGGRRNGSQRVVSPECRTRCLRLASDNLASILAYVGLTIHFTSRPCSRLAHFKNLIYEKRICASEASFYLCRGDKKGSAPLWWRLSCAPLLSFSHCISRTLVVPAFCCHIVIFFYRLSELCDMHRDLYWSIALSNLPFPCRKLPWSSRQQAAYLWEQPLTKLTAKSDIRICELLHLISNLYFLSIRFSLRNILFSGFFILLDIYLI